MFLFGSPFRIPLWGDSECLNIYIYIYLSLSLSIYLSLYTYIYIYIHIHLNTSASKGYHVRDRVQSDSLTVLTIYITITITITSTVSSITVYHLLFVMYVLLITCKIRVHAPIWISRTRARYLRCSSSSKHVLLPFTLQSADKRWPFTEVSGRIPFGSIRFVSVIFETSSFGLSSVWQLLRFSGSMRFGLHF